MENKFFEVKVRYEKTGADGKEKIVTEPYLINSVSFSDTETSIHKELEPYITGEFEVVSEKIANFSELIWSTNGDRWFKSKVTFVTLDEEKGVEKRSSTYMLVQANNVKDAYENIELAFADSVNDYEIPAISESSIMDVFTREDKPIEEVCKDFSNKVLDGDNA